MLYINNLIIFKQYLEQYKHPHKLIKSENGILDFTLNEQLEEKVI